DINQLFNRQAIHGSIQHHPATERMSNEPDRRAYLLVKDAERCIELLNTGRSTIGFAVSRPVKADYMEPTVDQPGSDFVKLSGATCPAVYQINQWAFSP